MDAHSFKRHKPNKKPSVNIPHAEVFAVVPPDLVQKFGIDSSVAVTTIGAFFTEEQLINADLLLSTLNGEETISETASLLKESILLTGSPNLAPTATKHSGETDVPHESIEPENSSKITAKGILYLGKSDSNDKSPWEFNNAGEDKLLDVPTEIYTTKSHEKESFIEPKDVKELTTEPEHKLEEERDENKNYYEIDENKRHLKDKIRNMVINKYANIREEQDNDNNDKNSPTNGSEKSDNSLSIKTRNFDGPSCTKPPAKISIISEEIVDSTKLRQLKCLHSSNVTLTPVTINSVIKPKKTDDTNDLVQTDRVIKNDENTQNLSLYTTIDLNGEKSHEFNSVDFVLQPLISMSKDADDLLTPVSHDIINGTCENWLEEPLDQHEKEPKNIVAQSKKNETNLSPVDVNDNAEKDNVNNFKNNCKKPTIIETLPNLNQNVIMAKSKLCVQGVEKPGGEQNNQESENVPTAIKTYRRSKRLNQSVEQNLNTISTNEVVYPTYEVGNREINAVFSSEECKYEEFCICEDFGKLNFYDSDIEYEHIHFWKGESMRVDPKLIFSLYDDEYC